MREVTKLMIRDYKIKQLNYDFMGYSLQKNDIYTFHHLIVPARDGGSYDRWNGAVLCGKTSHPYLHLIECFDYDIFCYISTEMLDMNIKGIIDSYNIKRIDSALTRFEKDFSGRKSKKGKYLIKEEYTRRKKL